MKFAATIVALYAAAAFAAARGPAEDIEAVEDIDPVEDMEPFDDEEPFGDDESFDDGELFDDLEPFNSTAWDEDDYAEDVFGLEKRRGCTGHRKTTDVCQGKFIAKMNSRHNWYVFCSLSVLRWSLSRLPE